MCSMCLSIFAIVLGTFGTVKTILSILKMRLKDIIYQRTALGQDAEELSILQQVYDARVGIGWIVLSGILQVIEKLCVEMNCYIFYAILFVFISITVTWWFIMRNIYRRSKEKLIEEMPQEIKDNL